VVVSLAILSVGAVVGLVILVQAQKANTFSRAKTMAVNAAELQMETIFRDAPSDVTTYNNLTFPVQDLRRAGGGDAGLITVTAAEPHLVTVSVVWQGQGTLSSGQVTLTALRTTAPR
jgi:type II secretory pathway pseudopilin PulG